MATSETYQKILKTARRLFVQNGYTATSMRQVAAEAGIGKATIYHHFPDKLAIMTALLEEYTSGADEALHLVQTENNPRQRIQVAVSASMHFLFEIADIVQIYRREIPGGRDQMQAGFLTFFEQYMSLLSDAIQRGVQQGTFRSVDPRAAARVLMTMIQGTFAMNYLGAGRPHSSDETATALLDIYFQGIDAP